MLAKDQDSNHYTIEVARNLPLPEQLRKVNAQMCFELRVEERVFLEEVQFNNGSKVLRYRFWRDEAAKK